MGWNTYDSSGAKIERSLTDFPVGTVVGNARSAIPYGWLDCDGSAVSRTAYGDLFSAIGTTYGPGNGTTTFNLPNSDGDMILAVSTAEKFGINDGSAVLNSSITPNKLSLALANNIGINQTGLTNRAVLTPAMTTERQTTSVSYVDVTGASMTFNVASGAYLLIGYSYTLRTSGDINVYTNVIFNDVVADASGGSSSTLNSNYTHTISNTTTNRNTGGMAMMTASQVGTGNQTLKVQFRVNGGTGYINNVNLAIIQMTF